MNDKNHTLGTVKIFDDRVEKTGIVELQRIEAAKLKLAYQIGVNTGLFSSPRLIDFDEQSGLLVMERIQDIQAIRSSKLAGEAYLRMMRQAGEALAVVHEQLLLPEEMKNFLPKSIDGNDRVFIHGDYSGENVCVICKSEPKLVLIDWQMTKMHGGNATFGSRYYDVTWFVNNLFSKALHKYFRRYDVEKHADAFLSSYFDASNITDHALFFKYQKDFFEFKMALRRSEMPMLKKMLFAKGHRSWKNFVYRPMDIY